MPSCRIAPRITRCASSWYADGLAQLTLAPWYAVAVFRRGVLAEKSKQLHFRASIPKTSREARCPNRGRQEGDAVWDYKAAGTKANAERSMQKGQC